MVIDGSRAQVELCGDFAVGQAFGDKAGDLDLLGSELEQRGVIPPACSLAGRTQLGLGPFRPRSRSQPLKQLKRRSQVGSRGGPLPVPAQPLTVEQFSARALERRLGMLVAGLAGSAEQPGDEVD